MDITINCELIDGIWIATSPDIGGLNVEADTLIECKSIALKLIPELINYNFNIRESND